jgi:hypothetical protein
MLRNYLIPNLFKGAVTRSIAADMHTVVHRSPVQCFRPYADDRVSFARPILSKAIRQAQLMRHLFTSFHRYHFTGQR